MRLPYTFAKRYGAICVPGEDKRLDIVVRPGADVDAIAEIRRHATAGIQLRLVSLDEFERHMVEIFRDSDESMSDMATNLGQEVDLTRFAQTLPAIEDLLESTDDAPVIRMVNALLAQAVRTGASDIHLEPFEQKSVVRYRIDGVLRDVLQPHRALHAALVSRIKIMAQMDIAEKRMPQDGRVGVRLGARAIDIRISTIPTGHGERVVMRLLDKNPGRLALDVLGMGAETLVRFDQLIRRPHGIVLVTGPTGSGKTTTLYGAISRLDAVAQNIMTVEDPIEYDLPHIGQTQVNPRIDLSFAAALRSILRQDPDVIMIGEIRDFETAQIAVQASLTGHLVLATLHTNDTASAITRLVDMGIEPFLLASGLSGVLAQRLVRRLCTRCKQAHPLTTAEADFFTEATVPKTLFRPMGCAECSQTGYQGRLGIYELLEVDDTVLRLIHERASDQAIRDHSAAHIASYHPLRQDGLRWVAEGETSLEEVLRVTRD
jgi:general secretion pathway protein E